MKKQSKSKVKPEGRRRKKKQNNKKTQNQTQNRASSSSCSFVIDDSIAILLKVMDAYTKYSVIPEQF